MLKREIIIESNQLTGWQGHFHLAFSLLPTASLASSLIFFSQTSFISLFLCVLLLYDFFFLHCCMSGICVCLFMKGRTKKKKTKKLPFMGSRKILCVALEAGFYVSSNFLLLHHRIFSFSVLFTKDHCLYVYAHHQKKISRSCSLVTYVCKREKDFFFMKES